MSQALALFVKVIRKITKQLQEIQKAAISAELPSPSKATLRVDRQKETGMDVDGPLLSKENDKDEVDAHDEPTSTLKEKQREMLQSLDLSK